MVALGLFCPKFRLLMMLQSSIPEFASGLFRSQSGMWSLLLSVQFLVTLMTDRTTGLGLSVPNGLPKPAELEVVVMNRPALTFNAVLESPNMSYAAPSRGDRSLHCGVCSVPGKLRAGT